MISQIIQVFQEIHSNPDDERVKVLTAFMNEAPHVTLCWQSFQFLKGDEKKLADALQKADVQVWVSGLACARNHLCSAIYNSLFSDAGRDAQIASVQALKGSFTRSTFCPPGCDCGWQFIAASRPEVLTQPIEAESAKSTFKGFALPAPQPLAMAPQELSQMSVAPATVPPAPPVASEGSIVTEAETKIVN
jgi:hypothetical protein